MKKLDEAIAFAAMAHAGQKRKYCGLPYIVHPIAVMALVSTVLPDNEDALVTAILHDVVEDTVITLDTIERRFGTDVAVMVNLLTDVPPTEGMNRAQRKAADRARLATAPSRVQTIKLADLIDNTDSIVRNDPDFAVKYLQEKEAQLAVLTNGHPVLLAKARDMLQWGQEEMLAHEWAKKHPLEMQLS